MNKSSFNKLLSKSRLGNKKAMEELYNALIPAIFATAFMYLKNKEDAEDMAEEVFWKIISYEGELIEEPDLWIKRIIRNDCYNFFKRQEKEDSTEYIDELHPDKSNSSADEILILKESISKLSELEQIILIDHIFWGYTLKKISKDQGIA